MLDSGPFQKHRVPFIRPKWLKWKRQELRFLKQQSLSSREKRFRRRRFGVLAMRNPVMQSHGGSVMGKS